MINKKNVLLISLLSFGCRIFTENVFLKVPENFHKEDFHKKELRLEEGREAIKALEYVNNENRETIKALEKELRDVNNIGMLLLTISTLSLVIAMKDQESDIINPLFALSVTSALSLIGLCSVALYHKKQSKKE
jgi:hypothetical protein